MMNPCSWWENKFSAGYHIATLTQTFHLLKGLVTAQCWILQLSSSVPKQSQALQRDTVHTATTVCLALVEQLWCSPGEGKALGRP